MNAEMNQHLEALADLQSEAFLAGLSPSLTGLASYRGKMMKLDYTAAIQLFQCLFASEACYQARSQRVVSVKESTEEFGVIALSLPTITPFCSYVCRQEAGKITAFTLVLSDLQIRLPLFAGGQIIPDSPSAKKKFYHHALMMGSLNARIIARDYAADAVVVTNMAESVCHGQAEIIQFCTRLMKQVGSILKRFKLHGAPGIRWKIGTAEAGMLLFVGEACGLNTVMTETYWISQDKIQFESSIVDGEMLQIVKAVLKPQKGEENDDSKS